MLTSEELAIKQHFMTVEEVIYLRYLTLLLDKNPIIVNIGAGAGTSALAMWEGRPDAMIYTIDIYDMGYPEGCLEHERKSLQEAELWGNTEIRTSFYNKSIIAITSKETHDRYKHFQIHGNSRDVGKIWIDYPVDMVMVDGDHSYESCKGDIEAWLPRFKKEGHRIIAFHDYGHTSFPGVQKAVIETLPMVRSIGVMNTLVGYWL